MKKRQDHWNEVYSTKPRERLGWYKARLHLSLDWINGLGLTCNDRIIDIGAGASTLVDDLIDQGHKAITALDISESALTAVRERLGDKSDGVEWIVGDIVEVSLSRRDFALWHDRAAFHFLTDEDERRVYVDRLRRSLQPGGHVIIGTFAPDAPATCSGLPVQRYDLDDLAAELGKAFELVIDCRELHVTPGGVEQMYQFACFRFACDGRA